jgi:hypothetical protein
MQKVLDAFLYTVFLPPWQLRPGNKNGVPAGSRTQTSGSGGLRDIPFTTGTVH